MPNTSVYAPIPIIDIGALVTESGDVGRVADEIGGACRESGFFYITGHDVNGQLLRRLETLSREFFAQDAEAKLTIRMELGGRAWRGYFPVGAELTLGKPDQKEGIYFGAELGPSHSKVAAAVPLHGPNLFPDVPGFRETVLDYLEAMTRLGHVLMEGIALSLGLEKTYFSDRYTHDPLVLFRIFHYPPIPGVDHLQPMWSVGEHTDYGLLTILKQDDTGGLQLKSRSRWVDAPPVPESFVVNIGDMLEKMTGGRYRSTPHRVRNESTGGRLSFPFFFDPNFDVVVNPIAPREKVKDDRHERWDGASVHGFGGTYGEYVLEKVAKVFPDLGKEKL